MAEPVTSQLRFDNHYTMSHWYCFVFEHAIVKGTQSTGVCCREIILLFCWMLQALMSAMTSAWISACKTASIHLPDFTARVTTALGCWPMMERVVEVRWSFFWTLQSSLYRSFLGSYLLLWMVLLASLMSCDLSWCLCSEICIICTNIVAEGCFILLSLIIFNCTINT